MELTCQEINEAESPRPDDDERHWTIGGGIDPPPDWAEYLADFEDEGRPYMEAAREWLLGREGGIPTADAWCNDHYLLFSDGRTIAFTWRGWGDFAQAVADRREGYMAYYSR